MLLIGDLGIVYKPFFLAGSYCVLIYMQQRYYDPVIGRFYSNDPIGFIGVSTFNRYSYVGNNPYKYTDPTGMTRESTYQQCKDDPLCENLIPQGSSGTTERPKQKFPSFSKIWNSYPKGKKGKNAKPSRDKYAINQCAIRVGVALEAAGMDISGYPKINQTSEGWPRSSKGLADWLWNTVSTPLIMSQESFDQNFGTATGIIYLAPPEGGVGHIDLWSKGETGSGYYEASEVWFWEINE